MDVVRHIALGCCILSTVAGMIRIFWPENSYTPVINAALVLYIITAVLQMAKGTNWSVVTNQLYDLAATSQSRQVDLDAYRQDLGETVSVEAIRTVLDKAGIEASVTWEDSKCRIRLVHTGDRQRTEALLEASGGTLPWEIVGG